MKKRTATIVHFLLHLTLTFTLIIMPLKISHHHKIDNHRPQKYIHLHRNKHPSYCYSMSQLILTILPCTILKIFFLANKNINNIDRNKQHNSSPYTGINTQDIVLPCPIPKIFLWNMWRMRLSFQFVLKLQIRSRRGSLGSGLKMRRRN